MLNISTVIDQADSEDENDVTVFIGEDAEAFKDGFEEISPFIMVSFTFFLVLVFIVLNLILYLKRRKVGAESKVLKFETMMSPKKDTKITESSILGHSMDIGDSLFYDRPNTANDLSFSRIDISKGEKRRNAVFEEDLN